MDNNEETIGSIEKFFVDIGKFNILAGNFENLDDTEVLKAKVKLYVQGIREEALEVVEAHDAGDITAVLAEAVDVLVVAFGLMQVLYMAGADSEIACDIIATKNLEKFHNNEEDARETQKRLFTDKCIDTTVSEVEGKFVVKDFTGKVRKPFYFQAPDVKNCIPERILEAYRKGDSFGE